MANLNQFGLSRRISSVRPWQQGGGGPLPPAPPGGRLVIYGRERYRGQSMVVDTVNGFLGTAGLRARSVQVTGVWEICEGAQFQGRRVTVSRSISDLDTIGMRNGIGSAR